MFTRLEYRDDKNGIHLVILTKVRCIAMYTHFDGTFWRCVNIDERSPAPNKAEIPCADFTEEYIDDVRALIEYVLDSYESYDKLNVMLKRVNFSDGSFLLAE